MKAEVLALDGDVSREAAQMPEERDGVPEHKDEADEQEDCPDDDKRFPDRSVHDQYRRNECSTGAGPSQTISRRNPHPAGTKISCPIRAVAVYEGEGRRGPAPGETMNRAEIKRIIAERGLRPNRRLGQNFLVSGEAGERIIGAMDLAAADRVLEVGPGLGALTGRLIELAGHVTAVEIDAGYSRYLAERFAGAANFSLVHADFLKNPPDGSFTKIVSNLPYYCSSEMLFGFSRYDAPDVYVMLQKEMAARITAPPGNKNYGALTAALWFYYEAKALFTVSRESFYPRPEVTSTFLKLSRRASFALEGRDIELFHALVKSAFWGRRKTLLRALAESPHLGGVEGAPSLGRTLAERLLSEAGIDGSRRGEELAPDEYAALARAYRRVLS